MSDAEDFIAMLRYRAQHATHPLSVAEWTRAVALHSDWLADPARGARLVIPNAFVLMKSAVRGIDLRNAVLDGAVLSMLDFRGSDLRGASLVGAHLSWSMFASARLDGADLRGSQCVLTDFQRASLTRARFDGVDVSAAFFGKADLSGVDLATANFSANPSIRFARTDVPWERLQPTSMSMDGPSMGL